MKSPFKNKLTGKPDPTVNREKQSRRFRRMHRIDRGRMCGLGSLSAGKMAPASLYVRHGLVDTDGQLLGYVPAPAPSTGGMSPSEWLKVKAARANPLTPDMVIR